MKKWRTLSGRAFQLIVFWVAQLLLPQPAFAGDGGIDLLSAETLTLSGDLRLRASDGEKSWVDDEFGKLRYGGGESNQLEVRPEVGEAALIWQPRLTWSLKGTVVAIAEGGGLTQAGLSEAYLSFKPLTDSKVKLSARAGLMWPPISLEHSGPEWAVTDTITPSAINSWVGEEVKVLGLELSVKTQAGEHGLTATAGVFDNNDTSGTLLAFRGWALHDRKALAFRKQPLPPLNQLIGFVQPRFTHPLLDLDPGFGKRPGYYARVAWEPPAPLRFDYFRYDNHGNPEAVNADLEWGWRTKFDNIGVSAELADDWQLRAQAMSGHTRMGFESGGTIWVDAKFRAAYAMVTRHFPRGAISLRAEAFGTRNEGSWLTKEDDEDGWAITVAARRKLGEAMSLFAEYLHVQSDKDARTRAGVMPHRPQNQLQLALRIKW